MTMEQLSAYTVKIQIEQEELPLILPQENGADSTFALQRMLLFLLTRAEAFSGIPFRSSKVTAELLSTPEDGVIVYLTAKGLRKPASAIKAYQRMGAIFTDEQTLHDCCAALQPFLNADTRSSLYRVKAGTLLVLEHHTAQNRSAQHLLREFASPCAVSSHTLARLAEYGQCLYPQNAVQSVSGRK